MKKMAYNRVFIDKSIKKHIRSLFFRQIKMAEIVKETGLTERIIRRIVNENKWINRRERYLRYLCYVAFKNKISLGKISEMTKVNRFALGRIHRKHGTPKPLKTAWNDRRTDIIEKNIVREYKNGLSGKKISEKYNYKTRKSVYDILKKNNIERKPSKVYTYYDESFFEKIDTSEKAYILGLIMTDGYIIKDYCGFGIQLSEEDRYILEKTGKLIGSTNKISHINCDTKRKTMLNAKDMYRLTVTNKKIAKDLMKLGVTRNKSKTLRYNGCVPIRYLSHFFRGLIDGDGTIGIAKNGNIWCQLASSSRKFINDILNMSLPFTLSLNQSTTKYLSGKNKIAKKCKMYIARVSGGNKKTIEFLKWMYNDKNDLYLRRKYVKVQNKIN